MQPSPPARGLPAEIAVSAIDPFSLDCLSDPHPSHEALREAGPIVWLEKYCAYAAARHAEVREILNDPATFCSSRGVGLSDFQREKPWRPPSLVLERDPPEHDRARAVLNRALSATVMRSLRARFVEAAARLAGELARKERFDAMAECAEVYPMMVVPDAIGLSKDGREHLLPYAATVFNMFGPDNELRRDALARMAPHVEWITAQCKRESLSDNGVGAIFSSLPLQQLDRRLPLILGSRLVCRAPPGHCFHATDVGHHAAAFEPVSKAHLHVCLVQIVLDLSQNTAADFPAG